MQGSTRLPVPDPLPALVVDAAPKRRVAVVVLALIVVPAVCALGQVVAAAVARINCVTAAHVILATKGPADGGAGGSIALRGATARLGGAGPLNARVRPHVAM